MCVSVCVCCLLDYPSSHYIVNQSFCYLIILTHPLWNRLYAIGDIYSLIMQLELNEAQDFISAPSIFLSTSSQM